MPGEYFFRLETTFQTVEDAKLQVLSKEIWGRPARGSNIPSVKAYRGNLPEARRGIQFTTPVEPEAGSSSPFEARWYYPHTKGVMLRHNQRHEDFAAIPAEVENRQP